MLRLLDKERGRIDLEELGMAGDTLRRFVAVISKPHGIVLSTGPTGSGKTTTLYAAVDRIRTGREKIITVEDPVEYELTGVPQVPVNEKVGLTFANALRALLRQDPDIMLVGEIRDQETADIATHAALTGHLVLSTLHTNDAATALTRLLDLGIEAYPRGQHGGGRAGAAPGAPHLRDLPHARRRSPPSSAPRSVVSARRTASRLVG